MATKQCYDCRETKLHSEFNRSNQSNDGLTYYCKSCLKKQRQVYKEKGQMSKHEAEEFRQQLEESGKLFKCGSCKVDKTAKHFYYQRDLGTVRLATSNCKDCQKDKARFYKFGITPEQFYTMLEDQGHKCKICNNTFDDYMKTSKRNFHIDHCHTTGKVRGLLCNHCNRGLGAFYDNPEFMRRAAEYAEREGDIV